MQHSQDPQIYLPQNSFIFSNLYDALKARMHSKHELGRTNPTTGNFSFYQGFLPIAHKIIGNFLDTAQSVLKDEEKHFRCRTGPY